MTAVEFARVRHILGKLLLFFLCCQILKSVSLWFMQQNKIFPHTFCIITENKINFSMIISKNATQRSQMLMSGYKTWSSDNTINLCGERERAEILWIMSVTSIHFQIELQRRVETRDQVSPHNTHPSHLNTHDCTRIILCLSAVGWEPDI